jgi:aldehyde:ferredoxin oxidoreductase
MNNNLLRINLTEETVTTEKIPDSVVFQYMGGTGYLSYFLYKELEAKIDPLSSDNKIILAPGPIQGTRIPISGRYSVGTKSPLTGFFIDGNAGGFLGPEIRFAGYDLIIIEGKSENPCYISIKDDKVEIKDAKQLWGQRVHETDELIKENENEPKMRILAIGPAGENQVKISCTTSDRFRNAGRGGIGAVFGSKNLKAVAIKGSNRPTNGNPDKIDEMRKELNKRAKTAKDDGHMLHKHGTSWLVNIANYCTQFPTRNFQSGEFEDHEKITHEVMDKLYKRFRRPCFQCPIACSETLDASDFEWTDEKEIAKPEYETLGMMGGNLGLGDIETIIHVNYLCNQLGLDTISTGSSIAMVMEAVEKGLLKGEEFEQICFGNKEAIFDLIHKIAYREGLGDILAEGIVYASKKWNIEHLAIHSKGLPFPAWDPRGKLGLGLSYATAAVGASHLRGWPATREIPDRSALEIVDSLVHEQDLKTIKDSLTICHFTHSITPPLIFEGCRRITEAVWDRDVSEEELEDIAKRIWLLKRMFNIREYGDKKPFEFDTLPKRFMTEPLPSGRAKGKTAFVNEEDFKRSMLALYEKRGLDTEGYPTAEEMKRLELEF